MKKILSFLKWFLPLALLAGLGMKLITYSTAREEDLIIGYQTHQEAEALLAAGDIESAYSMYLQAALELEDPKDKALVLFEAANLGWASGLADYYTLVGMYQQALRYDPDLTEAAFNLEYLYWLKENSPEQIPQPEVGPLPSRDEEASSGDV